MLPIKILSMATALPEAVLATSIDKKLNLPAGSVEKMGGVRKRHFAQNEKQSTLAAQAVLAALAKAGLSLNDVDALVAACGVPEQAIPCTAVLVARELNIQAKHGIACFDFNATCLSFMVALDALAAQITVKRFRTVVLVSADFASRGIDWLHMESACIFGDGVVAAILQFDESNQSYVIASHVVTLPEGWAACQISAGGTEVNPRTRNDDLNERDFLFQMDGKAIFKLAAQHIPKALEQFWQRTGLTMGDIDWVVPHQASHLGMHHVRKLLKIDESKTIDIYSEYGNQVAASMPTALYEGIEQGKIKRGDTVLLIGTGAGLTIGLTAFKY